MAANSLAAGSDGVAVKRKIPVVWKVTLDTDGGFSGRGLGNVSVESTGMATANDGGRVCRGAISTSRLVALDKAVVQAKPASWRTSYLQPGNPHGNADQIHYNLTFNIQRGRQILQRRIGWFDGAVDFLPRDLRAISGEIWRLREVVISGCR